MLKVFMTWRRQSVCPLSKFCEYSSIATPVIYICKKLPIKNGAYSIYTSFTGTYKIIHL